MFGFWHFSTYIKVEVDVWYFRCMFSEPLSQFLALILKCIFNTNDLLVRWPWSKDLRTAENSGWSVSIISSTELFRSAKSRSVSIRPNESAASKFLSRILSNFPKSPGSRCFWWGSAGPGDDGSSELWMGPGPKSRSKLILRCGGFSTIVVVTLLSNCWVINCYI